MRWANAQTLITKYSHAPVCVCCGSTDVEHLESDHIIPRAEGGSNAIDNLQLYCRACNHAKGTGPYCPLDHTLGNHMETQENVEYSVELNRTSGGASRKPHAGVPITLALPKDVAEILRGLGKGKMSEYVAKLVRADQALPVKSDMRRPSTPSVAMMSEGDRTITTLHPVLPIEDTPHAGFAPMIVARPPTQTPKRRWWRRGR